MVNIECLQGDITAQEVDAIVNAANRSLLGGGGVDGAIHRRGGPRILEECKKLRATTYPDGLPTGKAVATTAGNLKARWVIHTVGPIYHSSRAPADELRSCHVQALKIADELGAQSLAFPAISTGAYGYPVDQAAAIAIRAIRDAQTKAKLVRFVLFDKETLRVFEKALQSYAQ
jgi:O-acetyl-ADP-ribose deacetylase (regulator of RNase III)